MVFGAKVDPGIIKEMTEINHIALHIKHTGSVRENYNFGPRGRKTLESRI